MRKSTIFVLAFTLLATNAQADDSNAPAAEPAGAAHRTSGLIPGVLLGPKVSATLLFPPNVMVGAEVKVGDWVGASFEYGVFPGSRTVDDYELDIETWSAGLRVYPFRGNFFVGAVFGKYDLTATESLISFPAGIPESSTLNVESTYLGPQIGWKWDFDFGLFLGLNLGYGFALDYSSDLMQLPSVVDGDLQDRKEDADSYLKSGVPVLTLLELGWLF